MLNSLLVKILPKKFVSKILSYKNQKRLDSLKKQSHWGKINFKNLDLEIYLDKDFGLISDIIEQSGVYEPEILEMIIKRVPENCVFLDVGANIGQHSLIMSKFCKEIVAFEPIPVLQNRFEMNLTRNQIKNVQLYPFGLSNENIFTEMIVMNSHMGKSKPKLHNESEYDFLKKSWTGKNGNEMTIQNVELRTLDSFNLQKVDFIKIDVEGYEYFVLQGGLNTIKKFKPQIIMEYSPLFFEAIEAGMSKKIYELVTELGYKIFSVENRTVIGNFEDLPVDQCNLLLSPKDFQQDTFTF